MRKANPNFDNPYSKYKSHYEFCTKVFGETYTDDIKNVMDSVDRNIITIAKSANGTGKTHAAARIGISFKKRFRGSQIFTAAAPPESNLRNLLWGQIGSLVHDFPKVFSDDNVSLASMQIRSKYDPLEYIIGVTIPNEGTDKQREARFSGKHAPYILFIVDEGDAVPDAVYAGIEACLSGGVVRLLIMFNPRAPIGPVYEMERKGRGAIIVLSAFSHTNVITGKNIYPGAVDRETTVRRINEWSAPIKARDKIDSECFTVPDFLVGYVAAKFTPGEYYPPLPAGVRRITNPNLAQMVLARYPAQAENALISQAWIDAAKIRWNLIYESYGGRNPIGRPIMGLDVAEFGQDLCASAIRYGGFLLPIETWGGVDPLVTGERAIDIMREHNVLYCNVDSTGVGASVAPQIKRAGLMAHRIMVASTPNKEEMTPAQQELGEFKYNRDYGWWALREWLRTDPSAALPEDDDLERELLAATYTKEGNVIRVMDKETMREKLKRSPDKADALMISFIPAPPEGVLISKNYRRKEPYNKNNKSKYQNTY